ncbi:hypothetical protein PENSPDRAFT_693185 [Peniophora sp. CONT]|nr:hypothetical protein PENSPDRAFT_693185 [Peniophora sp. CONT]
MSSTPQLARSWYESFVVGSQQPRNAMPARPPRPKSRGGRKVGKTTAQQHATRQQMIRQGELRDYTVSILRLSGGQDPDANEICRAAETSLWNELYRLHINIQRYSASAEDTAAAYRSELRLRCRDVESSALELVIEELKHLAVEEHPELNEFVVEEPVKLDATSATQLHQLRRILGILCQEDELLTFDNAQCRAVGNDGAFVALGLRLKQSAFVLRFGWWDASALLQKHGICVRLVTPETNCMSDDEASTASSDGDASRQLDGSDVAALFEEGTVDDFSASDLLKTPL